MAFRPTSQVVNRIIRGDLAPTRAQSPDAAPAGGVARSELIFDWLNAALRLRLHGQREARGHPVAVPARGGLRHAAVRQALPPRRTADDVRGRRVLLSRVHDAPGRARASESRVGSGDRRRRRRLVGGTVQASGREAHRDGRARSGRHRHLEEVAGIDPQGRVRRSAPRGADRRRLRVREIDAGALRHHRARPDRPGHARLSSVLGGILPDVPAHPEAGRHADAAPRVTRVPGRHGAQERRQPAQGVPSRRADVAVHPAVRLAVVPRGRERLDRPALAVGRTPSRSA